jgi:DNA-binding MarR family transcriptional regulator
LNKDHHKPNSLPLALTPTPTKKSLAVLRSVARKHPNGGQNPAPKSQSPFLTAYLRFLARVETAQDGDLVADEIGLDPNEKALLEMVILRWAQRTTMTVRQTIAHAHLGSPATLHKRLTKLRKKGYLQLEDVEGDKRAKFLVPGPQGFIHMETMGKLMMGVRRSDAKAP